jgi:hypothetical protein
MKNLAGVRQGKRAATWRWVGLSQGFFDPMAGGFETPLFGVRGRSHELVYFENLCHEKAIFDAIVVELQPTHAPGPAKSVRATL